MRRRLVLRRGKPRRPGYLCEAIWPVRPEGLEGQKACKATRPGRPESLRRPEQACVEALKDWQACIQCSWLGQDAV